MSNSLSNPETTAGQHSPIALPENQFTTLLFPAKPSQEKILSEKLPKHIEEEIEYIGTQVTDQIRLYFGFSKEEFDSIILLLADLNTQHSRKADNGVTPAIPYQYLLDRFIKPQSKALAQMVQEVVDKTRPNEGWVAEVRIGPLASDMMEICLTKMVPGIRKSLCPQISLFAPKASSEVLKERNYCGFSIESGTDYSEAGLPYDDQFEVAWNIFPGGNTFVRLFSRKKSTQTGPNSAEDWLAGITTLQTKPGLTHGGPVELCSTARSRLGGFPAVRELLQPIGGFNATASYDQNGTLRYIRLYVKLPNGSDSAGKSTHRKLVKDTAVVLYDYTYKKPTTGDFPDKIIWQNDDDTVADLIELDFPIPDIVVEDSQIRVEYGGLNDVFPIKSKGPLEIAQLIANRAKEFFSPEKTIPTEHQLSAQTPLLP